MLLTAEQARAKSESKVPAVVQEEVKQIMFAINKEIENGRFEATFNELKIKHPAKVAWEFEKLGYKVQRQFYGLRGDYLTISWE